jgi:solute carrier family 13 (sodium-dependent dicarboxylate transporter), member 2/3/5
VPTSRQLLKTVASFVAALALTWLVKEPSFSEAQIYVLFLLWFSVGLWLTEAVPPFSVGFFILAYLAYALGSSLITDSPEDVRVYLNTLSSPVIWLMLGGFLLALAMTKTKLDADVVRLTMRVCGTDPKRVLFGMMTVTMVLSMLISNTATTAMVIAALMPVLSKLGQASKTAKALVLGIPIAASTGGMGTLIGSPPNAVAAGILAEAGSPVGFVRWIGYGLPIAVFLTLVAWKVLVLVFMKEASPLALENPPAGETTEPDSRAQRMTVLVIVLATVSLWLTSPLHHLSAAAVAAVPIVFLTMTRVLKKEDIRAIGWDTLILVAGGLALGTALQQTGLLDLYASRMAALKVPDVVFYAVLAYATMLASNVMSHTAASTVLIPVGMAILPENATEICLIIGLSASTALFLPVSTPPNAIAYSTGLIEQRDLRLGGILIGLLGPALIILWVMLLGP